VTGIRQDEPTERNRSCRDHRCGDASGVGTATAAVRAEREGRGDGRVYHIAYTATDPDGNACSGTVQVCVPHDRGRRGGDRCGDGGPRYDSLVCAP
jgi:hypothetical protein